MLYNHFADKEELLATALRAHVVTVEQDLGALPDPGVETVEANLRAYLAHGLALHRAVLPAFVGLIGQPDVLARFGELDEHGENWRDRLTGYLRGEQELSRIAAEARVGAAAAMLVGVCHEVVLAALFTPPGTPAEPPATEDVITVVLHGIEPRRSHLALET
ncbi:MAG TPA: TetR/AcrR family transcriptional regulator [Pseudonocardiaceae bacterium]|nr:TetR/AcrR family transcriptional regulator [Pseudonocardiaceae bacterium]